MLTGERPELSAPQLAERRRMLSQLHTLNADLLSHDSATAVLQSLCDHRDPGSPRIRARKTGIVDDAPAFGTIRHKMGAPVEATVRHRRVELMCGELVLCRADNWYLPDFLTEEMNARLLAGETPFGVVVEALGFKRRTLSSKLLFDPLAFDCNVHKASVDNQAIRIPDDVLQHRAMLQTQDGHPFSLLLETYTKHIFMA